MKITIEKKKVEQLPKGVVRVYFSEKEQTRLRETDTHTYLCIKTPKNIQKNRRKFMRLVRRIVRTANQYRVEKIALDIHELSELTDVSGKELGSLIAQNLLLAGYEFRDFKTKPKEGWRDVKEVTLAEVGKKTIADGVKEGCVIAQAVNECRGIANIPGGDMTPQLLASYARKMARNTAIKVTVLGRKEMERLKMGAVLGVAKGSPEEPKFIIMDYRGGKKDEKPVVLVGKGVTFDSGGINLKPSNGILGMHMDMTGGAVVMAAITLCARLKIKKNVVALVPSVENMPSGSALRPGDVLKSMSGKTIEVVDTDAEGRLILADALTYAKKFSPKVVIDVATLTGASIVALGKYASAVMTRDSKLAHKLVELGEQTGDYVWSLPLWEEYEEGLKGSDIADIANLPVKDPRSGGAIMGGIFLQQFAKDFTWAHIDIAPRMTSAPSDNLAGGAVGEPVRLLAKFIETA